MSETPDETQAPEPSPDWAEPLPDQEEQAEEEEQAQTPAEAAASHGSSDVPKRIERAVNDQRRRLGKILDIDLAGSECPACGGMGFTVGPAEPAAELVHPDNLAMCEACNGYGQVVTGSKNPQHQTTVCVACAGVGYQTKAAQPTNVTPIAPATASPAGPVMGFMNPDGSFAPFGQNMPQTVPQSG